MKLIKYTSLIIAVLIIYISWISYIDNRAKVRSVKNDIMSASVIVKDVIDDARMAMISVKVDKAMEEKQFEAPDYPENYDPYNPIANGEFTEEDWAAIQYEEAMNSLYNDIMHEQFDYKPDISDRVIKP